MINKNFPSVWVSGLLGSLVFLSIAPAKTQAAQIVTANRNSGNISVIDTKTKNVFDVPLPGDDPEPMYVFYFDATKEIAVGNRSSNEVVFFDVRDYSVTDTADAGDGVFHMWATPDNKQLWVNNDIENTITVIDPITKSNITTVPIPPDIVQDGGKPHDVILDSSGFAYVSILFGDQRESDMIVKFRTDTFLEVDRTDVGKDPHLSLSNLNNLLYVPAQNSNEVEVLDRDTLDQITAISVPGAHGAGMSRDGNTFYTTNLPGGGIDGLFAIDTATNTILSVVDTPAAVPHNIALTNNEVYVTHSGETSNLVSYYSLNNNIPSQGVTLEVGLNPFGIATVPTTTPESSSLLGILGLGVFGSFSLIKNKK